MQIDRIRISNFKSISELDINFQEISGLWEINGIVGAGKTTIGEAIIFGLFGSVRGKTNDNLIHWGKKHALVEIWLYCRSKHIYIRREINSYGQSPIRCTIDNEDLLGTNKRSLQNILETEWYDVNRNTIELLCIISFNNFKSLSTLNTADSREFLNSTINFNKIDQYEEYCKNQIKDLQDKIHKYELDIRENEGALKALENNALTRPKYNNIKEIDSLINNIRTELDILDKDYISVRKENERELKSRYNSLKNASTQLKIAKDNLNKLKNGICPLCGAAVTPEHLNELNIDIESHTSAVSEYQKLYDDIEQKHKQVVDDYNKKSGEMNEKLYQLVIEKTKTSLYMDNIHALDDKKQRYISAIQSLKNSAGVLDSEIIRWGEMLDFIKDTIRPTIIASLIPNINKYITYYMEMTHQNYKVYFDSSFKCMMTNPFNEPIPISSLSTGQKKIIDMVIILAFIKTFVSQIDFNIFFLDELISNMDADLRDTMCSLLHGIVEDHNIIFLISHSPIDSQYLDGIVKVSRNQGISQYSFEQL